MPLSIAALNWVYEGHASVEPLEVLRQVFVAQLLPLGLGSALRQARAPLAARIEPRVTRAGSLLLVGTVMLALANLWQPTVEAGVGVLAAIALVTVLALAAGHLLGGPPVAISKRACATRWLACCSSQRSTRRHRRSRRRCSLDVVVAALACHLFGRGPHALADL
jgi:predicted Na+-dependent transporter